MLTPYFAKKLFKRHFTVNEFKVEETRKTTIPILFLQNVNTNICVFVASFSIVMTIIPPEVASGQIAWINTAT